MLNLYKAALNFQNAFLLEQWNPPLLSLSLSSPKPPFLLLLRRYMKIQNKQWAQQAWATQKKLLLSILSCCSVSFVHVSAVHEKLIRVGRHCLRWCRFKCTATTTTTIVATIKIAFLWARFHSCKMGFYLCSRRMGGADLDVNESIGGGAWKKKYSNVATGGGKSW